MKKKALCISTKLQVKSSNIEFYPSWHVLQFFIILGFFLCTECQEFGTWENITGKITATAIKDDSELTGKKVSKKKPKKESVVNAGTTKWNELSTTCKSTSALTNDELLNVLSIFNLNVRKFFLGFSALPNLLNFNFLGHKSRNAQRIKCFNWRKP